MKKLIIFLIISAGLAVSCQENQDVRQPNVSAELTINGLSDSLWTYFSFEKGETVGSSKFGNEDQDSEWSERRDWDFAICGDRLKTNSGESGIGFGGVQRNSTETFVTLETAPEDGYLKDAKIRIR